LRVPNFGTYIVRFSIFVRTSGTLFVSKWELVEHCFPTQSILLAGIKPSYNVS
jgi:hypothetical protein